MTLGKDDLKAIGDLMDEKMLNFHHVVTEPMVDNIVEMLKDEIGEVSNETSKVSRKLDNITDMLAERVTSHEKRITKLEVAIA